jgi:DNA-binding transcriptional regulator YiaG
VQKPGFVQLCTMAKAKISKKESQPLDEYQKTFKIIGTRITELRRKAGFSSAEKFSNEHEFDRRTYGQWENGKPMSMLSIIRIAEAHGITLGEFFKGL